MNKDNHEIRAYIKAHLSSVYGIMITKDQQEFILKTYQNGASEAVYIDTDSAVIDGTDKTLCLYDYAKELLK